MPTSGNEYLCTNFFCLQQSSQINKCTIVLSLEVVNINFAKERIHIKPHPLAGNERHITPEAYIFPVIQPFFACTTYGYYVVLSITLITIMSLLHPDNFSVNTPCERARQPNRKWRMLSNHCFLIDTWLDDCTRFLALPFKTLDLIRDCFGTVNKNPYMHYHFVRPWQCLLTAIFLHPRPALPIQLTTSMTDALQVQRPCANSLETFT